MVSVNQLHFNVRLKINIQMCVATQNIPQEQENNSILQNLKKLLHLLKDKCNAEKENQGNSYFLIHHKCLNTQSTSSENGKYLKHMRRNLTFCFGGCEQCPGLEGLIGSQIAFTHRGKQRILPPSTKKVVYL